MVLEMDAISTVVDGEPVLSEVPLDAAVHEILSTSFGPSLKVGFFEQHGA